MAKEKGFIIPFEDVPFVELPVPEDARFGQDQMREVMELQVGSANNEYNPRIFRVDQSGQWMGQPSFITIPNEPVNLKRIKYQVDMMGNITATSFKTASSGQRIRIIDNKFEIYDRNGVLRVKGDDFAFTFYNQFGTQVGFIAGFDSPGNYLLIQGTESVFVRSNKSIFIDSIESTSVRINGNFFQVYSVLLDAIICFRPFVLASLPADPVTALDGSMFYADPTHPTDPDEFRVMKAGTWRNMITT